MSVTDELARRREMVAGAGEGDGESSEAETGEETGEAGEGTGEAGEQPTGEGAEQEQEEPRPPKLLQEPLPGDWDSISNTFGGADPDRAEIRLLGGKMPIDGSFKKGTEFDLLVRVRVTGVLGQDLEDAYGQKGGTVRRHFARMISVRRVNNPSPSAES